MKRRDFIKTAAGAAAATVLARPALAQGAWPQKDRPIKVIVPWPPGAANDALGRLVAERLQTKFGATAIVENRVGGAGLIGTKAVIQAEPDGYTFLASAFNTAVMPRVLKAADFNPETDLEVIARTATAPLVCIISASRPEKTLAEVIAAAKAQPGQWNFAISSLGSAGHLATIEMLRRVDAKITMVPYRGTQPALQDIMAGAAQLLIDPSFALLPAAMDGTKARALGIATKERSVLAPDVPTMAEAGLPGFEFNSWYGLWAPKGTPAEITMKVNALVQETMKDPAI
ncbi:MAG: Bug family tripartite tricarboxylate transporter substrate binding protein, partial [Beijerinckiaceae bacterium]